MKKFIFSFLIFLAFTSLGQAEGVTFEATVNSSHVSLDEVVQLTLTVKGVNDNLSPVSLPVIDGFSARYLGPSTRVSIVNGDYHSERAFIYNLFPNKVGHFQIPSVSITISGHTYTSSPVDIEVKAALPQGQSSNGGPEKNVSLENLKDKIQVTTSIGKTNVYLKEKIPVTITLLVNGVPIRDIQYPQFEKDGFTVDDFEKPEQAAEILDGVRYDTVRFKTCIYPNRLGDVAFPEVQIHANLLYKTQQENPFHQDNGFFGPDIFSNFFDSYASRPVVVASKPVVLHVSDLPQEGRGQDFSGAIGHFDFEATVSPTQVKAGDPLTLKMKISGVGNFKNIKMPEFLASGFKTYAPQVKDHNGEKEEEEVIIPVSESIKEVPALRFSYFDTSVQEYKTITQGPFAIQVTAPSPEQQFKAVGFNDLSRETTTSSAKHFALSKVVHTVYQFLNKLGSSLLFWVILEVLLLSWGAYLLWRRFKDKLEHDPAFARRLKARGLARGTLTQAQGFITAGKTKDFYTLISKTVYDYLANKWHMSPAALTATEISKRLKEAGIDEASMAEAKALLERSDLVCFAGVNRDASQMRDDLIKARALIDRFEKQLK
ncbi:MAG: protein BatD [Candidatus Omnitrophica bacterium]|nr:protein BatD [Candidatus Omnitrophota bacterium]